MELAIKRTFLLIPVTDVGLVGFIYVDIAGRERGRDLWMHGWVKEWMDEDGLSGSEEI